MSPDQKILIVEDDGSLLMMIKRHLENMGFREMITAANGGAAYRRLQEENVGLVISDWEMPGMDGMELLRTIRQEDRWAGIPFLMTTAHQDKESLIRTVREGSNHYIVKPFNGKTFKSKIAEVLNLPEPREP